MCYVVLTPPPPKKKTTDNKKHERKRENPKFPQSEALAYIIHVSLITLNHGPTPFPWQGFCFYKTCLWHSSMGLWSTCHPFPEIAKMEDNCGGGEGESKVEDEDNVRRRKKRLLSTTFPHTVALFSHVSQLMTRYSPLAHLKSIRPSPREVLLNFVHDTSLVSPTILTKPY